MLMGHFQHPGRVQRTPKRNGHSRGELHRIGLRSPQLHIHFSLGPSPSALRTGPVRDAILRKGWPDDFVPELGLHWIREYDIVWSRALHLQGYG